MRKTFSLIAAALLVTAVAYAQQQNPYPITGGNNPNPFSTGSTGSSNINCADPLFANSALCGGDTTSNALRGGGFGPSASGSAMIIQPQNQLLTYTDDAGRPTSREKSTRIQLPPQPLTEFQKFTASTTGMVLPIFGADLFQSVPSTFAPLDNAPVPPDYTLGPDDMIRIRMWGQVNLNANLRVDRTGDVYIPQVGAVHVAGVRFADLDQMVRAAVARIYRNFDLSVQLGEIRSIQIYITGDGRRPGAYTVSSLSTLVDALFATGGPTVQGSMRQIELRRGSAVVTTFDLYRFLVAGDKSKDARLQPGDVIHIPTVGPQIAVLGSVRRPAIYELLPGETVADALKAAGNLTPLAAEARASLERTVDRTGLQAMEVRLDTAGLSTPLRDGDILRVLSIVSRFQKTVTLRGNTANPGRFAWHEGMRLSDLIPDKDSLITREYWWKRASLGLPSPEFQPMPALTSLRQPSNPIDLPLQQSLERQQPNPRQPGAEQTQTQPVQNQPENQPATASQPPLFWDNPFGQSYADLYGQQTAPPAGAQAATPANSINQPQSGPRGSQSALAEPDDETQPRQPVNPRSPRRTVVQLGVPEIDWSYAVIERMNPEDLKTELVPFDLGKLVLQHDPSQDLELKAGDIVTVFSQGDIHVPLAEQTTLVHLEGEFVHSGTYSARPGETLRSLVERAGGLTSNAYLYGSVFTRESARILQQRRMDENVHEMILQMQRGNLALASSPTSTAADLAGVSAAQSSERELVSQLQQLRATGRIVFSFQPDSRGPGTIPEVPLENGDSFLVPSVPSTVNAVGAIFNQNSFLYQPDSRVGSYLNLAGGFNSNADKKRIFLVRANGAVISRESVSSAWGNQFMSLRLNPGDTIVVPDKTLKPSALRGFLDWSQIFAQMGIGIAAIRVLFP